MTTATGRQLERGLQLILDQYAATGEFVQPGVVATIMSVDWDAETVDIEVGRAQADLDLSIVSGCRIALPIGDLCHGVHVVSAVQRVLPDCWKDFVRA